MDDGKSKVEGADEPRVPIVPNGTNIADGPALSAEQLPTVRYRPYRRYKATVAEGGAEESAPPSSTKQKRRRVSAAKSADSAPTPAPLSPDELLARQTAQSLLDAGRAAASSIVASDAAKEKNILAALEKVMKLRDHLTGRPSVAKRLYEEQAIRLTKATKNEFLPVVKLVFGDAGRSNISRHAKVLRYVADNRDNGESFSETVDRGDGLVACAKADTARYQGPARQRAVAKRHSHLTQLRAGGIALSNTAVAANVEKKFTALLVERAEDGTLTVIGVRAEPELAAISRYRAIRR